MHKKWRFVVQRIKVCTRNGVLLCKEKGNAQEDDKCCARKKIRNMELKSYQQKVIENLEEYLTYVQEQKDLKTAFKWTKQRT